MNTETMNIKTIDAMAFYGASYDKANDLVNGTSAKLDLAYERLCKAILNETNGNGTMGKVGEGLLTLACKAENEAFA